MAVKVTNTSDFGFINDDLEIQKDFIPVNEKVIDSSTHETNPFVVHIIKQTVHSATIGWSSISGADVYEIEKYHKRRGWEQVAWKSKGPVDIENLEDNFSYRIRIKALRFDEEKSSYVELGISDDIVARTLAAQPTTLCLHRTIKKGQQFLVKRILRRRPSLIVYPGPNGYLPLANAIAYGENCVADVLLSTGACVHIGNSNNGRTPLHVCHNYTQYSSTAVALVSVLMQYPLTASVPQLAFFHGRLPVARILLNKKAQLDANDINGMTACHFAIDANQFEMLKFGIENHANLEATDACGWTLLLRAVVMGSDINVLKLLIMHGADRNALDKLGQSCEDLARLYHNEAAMKYFEQIRKSKKNKV